MQNSVTHASSLSLVKRRQLRTISSLPEEIFSEIFSNLINYCAEAWPRPSYRWIKVMLVCRDWRNVIISTPWLWKSVSAAFELHGIERIIALSKSASLTVDIRSLGASVDFHTKLQRIFNSSQRVEWLRVVWDPDEEFESDIITTLITSRPAPRLRRLEIAYQVWEDATARIRLPKLDPASLPTLEVLHLQGCDSDWNTLVLRGLTGLHLEDCAPRITSQQLFLILSGCPLLESLLLSGLCAECVPGEPIGELITLPALKLLRLTASYDACSFIVRCCRLPVYVSWIFCCIFDAALGLPDVDFFPIRDASAIFASVFMRIFVFGQTISCEGILEDRSGQQYRQKVEFMVSTHEAAIYWPDTIDVPKLIQRNRWEACKVLQLQIMPFIGDILHDIPIYNLLSNLPALRDLQFLYLSSDCQPSPEEGHAVNLIVSLLGALTPTVLPQATADSGIVTLGIECTCPNLKRFSMEMPFSRRIRALTVWNALVKCVSERANAGIGFCYCRISTNISVTGHKGSDTEPENSRSQVTRVRR